MQAPIPRIYEPMSRFGSSASNEAVATSESALLSFKLRIIEVLDVRSVEQGNRVLSTHCASVSYRHVLPLCDVPRFSHV